MPGGDRTGPVGGGPMTGRGMGYCVGRVPRAGAYRGRGAGRGGGMGAGYGRGFGMGAGRGYGYGRFYPDEFGAVAPRAERDLPRFREDPLVESLQDIRDRLARLESGKTD